MKTKNKEGSSIIKPDWYRVTNDVNGNPRYVIHYLELDEDYLTAENIAVLAGGKVYRAKAFGGGFVFSSYSLPDLEKQLSSAMNTVRDNKKKVTK